MSMIVLKTVGALIVLATVAGGALMIYDFHTKFVRFERIIARREARQARRATRQAG